MTLIGLEHINGTPVFVSDGMVPGLERVHAGMLDMEKRRWIFPAYLPFGLTAVDDMRKVVKGVQFSPEAEQHIKYLEEATGTSARLQVRDQAV